MNKQTYEQLREELILRCKENRLVILHWGKDRLVVVGSKPMTLFESIKHHQRKMAELRKMYHNK